MSKIWSCKIGECEPEDLEKWAGADGPMRAAIEKAYLEVTGLDSQFCFSGWGAKLDERERAVVENRPSVPTELEVCLEDFSKIMASKNEVSSTAFYRWLDLKKLIKEAIYAA